MKNRIALTLMVLLAVTLAASIINANPFSRRHVLTAKDNKGEKSGGESGKKVKQSTGNADPAPDKGERQVAIRTAKVNFKELARKSALDLMIQNQADFVPERESDETMGDMPVPPGIKQSSVSVTV